MSSLFEFFTIKTKLLVLSMLVSNNDFNKLEKSDPNWAGTYGDMKSVRISSRIIQIKNSM